MKLITHFELASKNTQELHTLFRDVAGTLPAMTCCALERTNALASLQNISRELASRFEP